MVQDYWKTLHDLLLVLDWLSVLDHLPILDWLSVLDHLPILDWLIVLGHLPILDWLSVLDQLPILNWFLVLDWFVSLLQRVMRFRGANRSKGDLNAASWFTRPGKEFTPLQVLDIKMIFITDFLRFYWTFCQINLTENETETSLEAKM